ncbi:hypothetical protein [Pontiella sulfatireligans]|uniref:hypothetical protein n=1 Tax=Pontiella sulfatireligans TaxID=2750658 RepID=UPI00109C3AF2|nr:hypothetical protein [Pontiella sulfatireligans]
MNDTDQTEYLMIPQIVFDRDGPFEEFKQDASIISVELENGKKFSSILVLYPNYIIAMESFDKLPFDTKKIIRAFQTKADLKKRSKSTWTFWDHPWNKK